MIARGGWRVERLGGPAGRLHAEAADLVATSSGAPADGSTPADLRPALTRAVRVMDAESPALVLGSTQPVSQVDAASAASAGVDVARRRSGGGAVLVGPDEVLWVDVVLPAGDPLWEGDVGRAGWWIGGCWARAIATATGATPEVWQGPLVRTRWSPMVCFAGLGPGEVVIDGVKVVGVSQRRTRRGILFQTAALLRWQPAPLMDLFALDPSHRQEAVTDLGRVAAGLGGDAAPALLAALLEELDRAG